MQTDDLRPIVEALDHAMARCRAEGRSLAESPELRECWARLVEQLAAESPPRALPPGAAWRRTRGGWTVKVEPRLGARRR